MSVIEVVIGAIMISIVLVAVVMTLTSAGQAQQRSKVRQQMTGSADGTLEALRADKTWVASSLSGPTCVEAGCPIVLDAATQERVTKGKDGRVFDVVATGWPVDSDGDGIGPADADRVVPDYVRVSVRVSMSAAQQEQFGTQKPFTIVSTIDMAQHAGATGTLVVQTCEVANQVDERARIENCDRAKPQMLAGQPAPCRETPATSLAELLADRRTMTLGCNEAIDAARGTAAAIMLVRPTTTLGFRLAMTTPDGARLTRLLTDGQRDAGRGTYTFAGIPAGTWAIEAITPGPGYEIWKSKAVPSSASVTVPANQRANALLVQRLLQRQGTYTTSFSRTVQQYTTTTPQSRDLQGTQLAGGVAILASSVEFNYRRVVHAGSPRWSGPAWNGSIGTEAKPAGRYLDDVTQQPAQRRVPVRWQPRNGGGDYRFTSLGTGLHNTAEFRTCNSGWHEYHCGFDTKRSNRCVVPSPAASVAQEPGRNDPGQEPGQAIRPIACNDDFAWIEPRGTSNVETGFTSEGGECYLDGGLVEEGAPRYRQMCDPTVYEGIYQLESVSLRTVCIEMVIPWGCMGTFRASWNGPADDTQRVELSAAQIKEGNITCFQPPSGFATRTTEDEDGNKRTETRSATPPCFEDPHGARTILDYPIRESGVSARNLWLVDRGRLG